MRRPAAGHVDPSCSGISAGLFVRHEFSGRRGARKLDASRWFNHSYLQQQLFDDDGASPSYHVRSRPQMNFIYLPAATAARPTPSCNVEIDGGFIAVD